MKQLKLVLLLIPLLTVSVVNAEQVPLEEVEVYSLKLKLSNDGTGIIKDMPCDGCAFRFGKITKNTKAYVDAVNVDLMRVRERIGRPVAIQFVRSTGEVIGIYW
jgi:hypothetical protein